MNKICTTICGKCAQHMRNICGKHATFWKTSKNMRICTTYAQHMRNTCEMLEKIALILQFGLQCRTHVLHIFSTFIRMFFAIRIIFAYVLQLRNTDLSYVFHNIHMLLDSRHSIVSDITILLLLLLILILLLLVLLATSMCCHEFFDGHNYGVVVIGSFLQRAHTNEHFDPKADGHKYINGTLPYPGALRRPPLLHRSFQSLQHIICMGQPSRIVSALDSLQKYAPY
jgi:hypothetical protein